MGPVFDFVATLTCRDYENTQFDLKNFIRDFDQFDYDQWTFGWKISEGISIFSWDFDRLLFTDL